jgi:hypothetical protein
MSDRVGDLRRCCIAARESVHATTALVVAAGRAIAAEQEFNARFLAAKSSASEADLLERLERYEALIAACQDALVRFEANPSEGAPALVAVLQSVPAILATPAGLP